MSRNWELNWYNATVMGSAQFSDFVGRVFCEICKGNGQYGERLYVLVRITAHTDT